MNKQLTIGDEVFYLLPRGNGRPADLYLRCVVLKVGTKGRATVRPTNSKHHRNCKTTSLVRTPPEGAWIR